MGKIKVPILSSTAGVCTHPVTPPTQPANGVITDGATSVLINNRPTAVVGSKVTTVCPICGTGVIVEGDSTVMVEGKPIAVLGSKIILGSGASGTVVSGSSDVM